MNKHKNLTDKRGDFTEARQDAEALFLLGTRRLEAGMLAEAAACLREALALDQQCAEAHANLALVYEKLGAMAEAESHYQQALQHNPNLATGASNYANFLSAQKRFAEAEQMHLRALAAAPESPVCLTNLGVLYAAMQREADAEACHRRALANAPDYATARFNLSYLMLRQGRYEEGWRCFEARQWYANLAAHLPCPRWQGESLQGKSILIGCDAGHGDMIQFCRYVPWLKSQGASRVDMICHPGLVSLFETLDGINTAIPFDQTLPNTRWDAWVPLMSLPFHHGTRLETIPANIPYLHVAPQRAEEWKRRLQQKGLRDGGLRVGIVWQGNPRYENDAERSLPELALLKPLAGIKGVQLVSLQKGRGEAEAESASATWPLLNLAPQIRDFADTAAIIAQLDLVITVDTAVAHLTGALGKPCWVMLPDFKTDWRWLRDRSDTPWYPKTMTLFRQTSKREWPETIAAIGEALGQLAGNP